MDTKICNTCKKEKHYTLFTYCKTGKFQKSCLCKECLNIRQRKYRAENKEKTKLYNEKNKIKIKEHRKKCYYNRSEEQKQRDRDKTRRIYKKFITKRREYDKLYSGTYKGVYNSYKKAAKKRNHQFLIPISVFKFYYKKECHYCGNIMKKVGFDRKVNSIGYLLSNIVPCCGICNKMKMVLDKNIFIEHCIKISKKHSEIIYEL